MNSLLVDAVTTGAISFVCASIVVGVFVRLWHEDTVLEREYFGGRCDEITAELSRVKQALNNRIYEVASELLWHRDLCMDFAERVERSFEQGDAERKLIEDRQDNLDVIRAAIEAEVDTLSRRVGTLEQGYIVTPRPAWVLTDVTDPANPREINHGIGGVPPSRPRE
jgi:hypothetical protein